MYAVIQKPLTFEEFLAWDDGSGRDFELRDGIPMPFTDPNANHEDVADNFCELLADHCKELDLPYIPKRSKQVKVRNNPVTGKEESRKADIVVFAKNEWQKVTYSRPSPLRVEGWLLNDSWYPIGRYQQLCLESTGCPTADLERVQIRSTFVLSEFYPPTETYNICYWMEPHILSFQGSVNRAVVSSNP